MWVCLNDSFFSIVDEQAKLGKASKGKVVQHKKRKANDRDILVVRARRHGDIEKVFASLMKIHGIGLEVTRSEYNDYRFRARIPRRVVKEVMAAEVDRILYGNFKNSVESHELHEAYSSVWSVMLRLQEPAWRETYPSLFDGASA